jgi:hypothetical protein
LVVVVAAGEFDAEVEFETISANYFREHSFYALR